MARIAGVTLPDGKRAEIGLTVIYGIGRNNARAILRKAAVDPAKKIGQLSTDEITRIQKAIEEIPVEGGLRKIINENIGRLESTESYRGSRHAKGLPVRGQRTRSNARTRRGKRRTVGAIKKKEVLGGKEREETGEAAAG
jgi:small subunit ribosomal protein S13